MKEGNVMPFNPDSQDCCNAGQPYPSQMDRLAHRVEELDHELEQMKRLLRVVFYTLYYDRENLVDLDYAAMKLGLGPQERRLRKPKPRKYDDTLLDILEVLS